MIRHNKNHVGTAALGCPGEQSSPAFCLSFRSCIFTPTCAELRSAGQPRAAVPTWVLSMWNSFAIMRFSRLVRTKDPNYHLIHAEGGAEADAERCETPTPPGLFPQPVWAVP